MKLLSIAISDLKEYISSGYVYFWGAGKAFETTIQKVIDFVDLTFIKGIVDIKQTGSRSVGDKMIPLISPEKFLEEVSSNDVLIITTKYFEQILDFLIKSARARKLTVMIYRQLLGNQFDKERDAIKVPASLRATEKQLIPKKIHYCWFGKNPVPEQYKQWMKSWKKYCSDYEIVEWNESNYDVHKNKFVEQAYEAGKWAFVSDYARLDVVYNYGGVYLDTDVELIRNIDDLLYNESFCGFEQREYVAFGLGYGAVHYNAIIREIMNVYENLSFIDSDGKMNLITCPVIQTEVLEKHGLKKNGEYQVVDGMAVFPSVVLAPLSIHTFKLAKNLSNSYMIHHFTASWNQEAAESFERLKKLNALAEMEW